MLNAAMLSKGEILTILGHCSIAIMGFCLLCMTASFVVFRTVEEIKWWRLRKEIRARGKCQDC